MALFTNTDVMKRITHTILLLMMTSSLALGQAFITTWKTDNLGTSGSNQITIPTIGSGYNYSVDWGDGNSDTGITGTFTHTYASSGTYTVSITGTFPRIYFNNTGDKSKILSIEQWGNIAWMSMENSFAGCDNIVINASDAPNLSGVTSLSYMFNNCSSLTTENYTNWDVSTITNMFATFYRATNFNGNISNWNVGNVTTMQALFGYCIKFNQDLSAWDVSKVTNMKDLFYQAIKFNGNIGSWDTGNVTNMSFMLYKCSPFNQDISGWDVSKVTNMQSLFGYCNNFNQDLSSWDVSQVSNMQDMFFQATHFNSDIGNWNTGNVTNMSHMFYADNTFNQDISGWDVSGVIDMTQMFRNAYDFDQNLGSWDITSALYMTDMFKFSGLSSANYDNLLTGWAAQTVQNNVDFGAGTATYCDGAADRNILTSTYNWIITDGGEYCLINIPDANFKAALLAHTPIIDTNDDDEIQVSEAAALTGHLNVPNKGINDLTGIEYFVNITQLTALGNNLTTVDVSALTALTNLGLSNNNLTSLDITSNTSLKLLYLENNDLTSLNLSANDELLNLQINGNLLTSLDLSSNSLLQQVSGYNNDIATVNLTGLTKVTNLNLTNNPITSIDLSDMIKLDNLTLVGNDLSTIDLTNNGTIRVLTIQNNNLTSLDISPLTNINWLYAQDNDLTSITMSNSTAMTTLFLGGNQLTGIDLSANTGLTDVRLMDNDFTSLDFSANTALEKLYVNGNNLQSLNLKNGNNAAITTFDATNNPQLSCITVDDVAYAEANFTNVDPTANFSTNCNNTANAITAFSFSEQTGAATIDAGDHDVEIEVVLGTDLSNLVPTFIISAGASANPTSGIAQDFSSDFTYTITAENPNAVQTWTIRVLEENVAPDDISLSSTTIEENNVLGEVIGTFSVHDDNSSDVHFITLVTGAGDSDNSSFEINDEGEQVQLIAKESFDFESKVSYSIRVKAVDTRGGEFEKIFSISITDIVSAPQTISITTIANKSTTDGPFDVEASSDSALPLIYAVTGPASIIGKTITLDGTEGTVTVTVSQAGDDYFDSAEEQTTFEVLEFRTSQTITFTEIENQFLESETFELSATASSGLPVTFEVVGGPASVSGNTLTLVDVGEVTILASQEGDASFLPAEPVQQTFEVILVTGMTEQREPQFKCYPNPVDHSLIVIPNGFDNHLSLQDAHGRIITSRESKSNDAILLDVSALPLGMYILKLYNEKGVSQTKILKK